MIANCPEQNGSRRLHPGAPGESDPVFGEPQKCLPVSGIVIQPWKRFAIPARRDGQEAVRDTPEHWREVMRTPWIVALLSLLTAVPCLADVG